MGVHHGYNVDNDQIWKDIIDRMKNCVQVCKSRKLIYKGKTIIVKNLLISYCGFEIEMKGIPDENGGMGMVNLDSYIDSRKIHFLYRIINEPIESWNAIGKYWLSRLDLKFNVTFFVCKCSYISSLKYPLFYQKSIQAWTKFFQCVQRVNTRTYILHDRLFRNCNITFQKQTFHIFFIF